MTAWISLLLLLSIPLKPSTDLECLDVVMEQSGLWMAVSCDTVEVPSPETVDASESRLPDEPAPFVRPLTKISKDDLILLWNQPAQGYVYKLWNFFIDVPQKNASKVDSSLNYYNNCILPCPAMAAKYVESRRWRLTDARAEYGWFARWKERWGVLMLILLLLPMWLLPMCCWQLTTLSRCRFSNTKLSHGMYIEAILESWPCKAIN